jgi:hypothetical protein
MMGAARAVVALAAIAFWAACIRHDGAWFYLVPAVSFTVSWAIMILASGNHRVDQMTEDFTREQRGDDPR